MSLALMFLRVQGFIEVGVYSRLETTRSFNHSTEISGWKDTGSKGLGSHNAVNKGATFDSNFTAPLRGIYYVSTILLIERRENTPFKITLVVNHNLKYKTGLTGFQSHNKSVTVSGLVQLFIGDTVSVYVECENGSHWTVLSRSTFFVQLVRSMTNHPAFQASLSRDITISTSTWRRLDNWNALSSSNFQFLLGFSQALGTYCTSFDGIYQVHGNILLDLVQPINGSVALFLNDQNLLTQNYLFDEKYATASPGGIFKLKKGDCLALKARSLQGTYKIQERSGFSALFLATDACAKLLHAASYKLSAPVPVMTSAGLYTIGPWSANPSPFFESTSVVLVNGTTYQVQIEGQYLINAQVNTRASSWSRAENLQLLVIVNYKSSSVQSAASIVTKETISSVNSLALTGILYLKKGQTITLCVYKDGDSSVSLTTNTLFSVTMVPKDWPGVSATLKNNQIITNAGWNKIENWKIGDLTEGSFSFDCAFDTTTGRYMTPIEGTYIVSSTVILYGTARSPLEMMIAVDGKVDTTTGLYAYQKPFKDYITLSTSGLIRLSPGQHLSVFISIDSGTTWTVNETSFFSVALNGAGKPDEHGFIGVKPQKADYTTVDTWEEIMGWESRDITHQSQDRWDAVKSRYTPVEEGLYYISVNLIISYSIVSSFHVMVAGDGKNDQFSSCQNYYSASSTNFKFSFTASCSVKLSPLHYVSVFVKSTRGGSWSVLGNSSISIGLISPISNPHRAGYNSVIKIDDRNQKTFKSLTYPYDTYDYGSRYNEKINLIDLSATGSYSVIYITVLDSGLYYVGLAVTFELHDLASGDPEYRIALCYLVGDNTMVPFTMLATKSNEGPTERSKFGFTAFAVVYLTKGRNIYVCHQGDLLYKMKKFHSGFSIVKIVPRDMNPGLHQTGVASVADVSSSGWTVVSDWKTRAESSLYRSNIVNPYAQESVIASQGTYLFTSSLSITDIPSAPVSMCIGEQLCSQCYLESSIHQGGLSLSGAVRLTSQQSIYTCVRHKSLAVTRSAQLLPQATANTSLFFRHSSVEFTSSGLKTLSSWLSDTGLSVKNLDVAQGLYIIAINIVLRSNTDAVLKVSVNLDAEGVSKVVQGLHGVSWAQANQPISFGLTSLIRLSAKNSLDITVHSDSSSSWKTEGNATLSLALLTLNATHPGFAVKRPFGSFLSLNPTWWHMGDWIEQDIRLDSPLSLTRSGRYIVDENGIYVVLVTLSVAVKVPAGKKCTIEMVISIGGLVNGSSLKTLQVIQGQDERRTVTLSIASSVRLYKWQAVFPMIRTGVPVDNVNILPDSIFYVALIDKERYYPQLNDSLAPYITVHPVSYVRVAADACQSITLLCEAQSDLPIQYEWLKNGQFYEAVQNVIISNARLSDAGRYVCVAKSSYISLTSSYSTVEVFASSPVFSQSHFNVSVNETLISNQRLLDLHATAMTTNNDRANVSFTIIAGNVNNTFKISPSVSTNVTTLFFTSPLDYELRHTYVLSLMATNTNTRQFSVVLVTVRILDLNDNYPVFTSQNYSTSVPEGAWIGAAVVYVTASDKDSGSNGNIQYAIESGNNGGEFAINSQGLIIVNKSLDYEHRKRYDLTISARDLGNPSLNTSAYVTIIVADTNDIDPVFSRSTYSFAIAENSPVNTSVGRVNASDSEEGNNGRIIYSIQDVQMRQIFSVDKTTGEIILLQSPDYEVNKTFSFVVLATDQGSPPRFCAALVLVSILDGNDNPPVFISKSYSVDITESTLVGTDILFVRTEDKDSEVHSNVVYNITSGDKEVFSISNAGIIRLVKPLDRENVSQYNLSVEAYDRDSPSLMPRAVCSVVINVEDDNDHPPQFNKTSYQASIPENTRSGYNMLQVHASDRDSGSNAQITYALDYTCSSPLVNQTFDINKTSGVVTLTNQIDRDILSEESLRLVIVAKDGGSPPLASYVDVVVIVTDVNDNPPIFEKSDYNPPPFPSSVDEDQTLVTVMATDKDIGNNSLFDYTVELLNSTEGCEGIAFRIDSNGSIHNKQELKRGCNYTMVVTATDRGEPPLSGTTTVRISVETATKTDTPAKEKSISMPAEAMSVIIIMGIVLVILIIIVVFIIYKLRRRHEYLVSWSNNKTNSQETRF